MKEKHIVLAFDLSSACVGVVAASVNNSTKQIERIVSCPIIPKKFTPSDIGYKNSKKRLPTKSGEILNTYWKDGEISITKTEKKRRDVEVRNHSNLHTLDYIGKAISKIIKNINPDIIVVEKNEIFNGVLTSVLLGKVMGVLVGLASAEGVPLIELKVREVRSIIDLIDATTTLVSSLTEEELSRVPDVTKRALRKLMESKYGDKGLKCSTDDESDACVVFNYYYENIFKKS